MSHPKTGDVVKFRAYGRVVNAIVLAAHYGEVAHHGKMGEPLLDLVFIDPERESAIEKKQIGWHPCVWTEFSVVHSSHEFSADYKRQKGLGTPSQITGHRGAGEWQEIATEGPEFLARLRAGELDDKDTQTEAGKAIEMLKGTRGDLANPGEGNWKNLTDVEFEAFKEGLKAAAPAIVSSLKADSPLVQAYTPEQIAAFNAAQTAAPGTLAPVTAEQLSSKSSAIAQLLEEGFTAITGSSALTAYRYNPAERIFEVVTQQGLRYSYENVEPERAQAFELAPSKGTAWNRLLRNPSAQL